MKQWRSRTNRDERHYTWPKIHSKNLNVHLFMITYLFTDVELWWSSTGPDHPTEQTHLCHFARIAVSGNWVWYIPIRAVYQVQTAGILSAYACNRWGQWWPHWCGMEYISTALDLLSRFSTRQYFARGAEFLFVFSNQFHPRNHKTKKNCALRAKFHLVENRLFNT
jgi:hypothetical protein